MPTETIQSVITDAARQLLSRLRDFSKRRIAVGRLRVSLWMLALAAGGLVALAWLDLLVELPPLLRATGLAAVIGGCAACYIRNRLALRRSAAPPVVARDVDKLAESAGQVAAGLDLTELPDGLSPLTVALADMAVRKSAEIAGSCPEEKVEPLSRAASALRSFMGTALALVLFAVLWPRVFHTQLLRLADPWGDHPPYTRLVFHIKPGDTTVTYGKGLTIEATVEGLPAERLDLGLREQDGSKQEIPMFEERDGGWRAQLTDVTAPLTYWVRAPKGRSRSYTIGIIYTPQIERVAMRLSPPLYTNLPPTEGPLPQGGISGLRGTQVSLTAHSNRPLSGGELRLSLVSGEKTVLNGKVSDANKKSASWEFTIEQPGELSLSVKDERGERSAAEIKAPILVLKDERPLVRIIEPKPESFATPDIALPVVLEAEDDYGISTLSVFRSLNGSRHLPDRLMTPLPPAPRLRRTSQLLLKDYGLTPGDVISLFGRVEDSDPGGAKGHESSVVRVTIISREDFEKMARARKTIGDFESKYFEAARRLETLRAMAEELSKASEAEKSDAVSPQMQEKLRQFAEALKDAAANTEKAANEEPLYALDEDLAKPLHELVEGLKAAAGEAEKAASAASPTQMREGLAAAGTKLGWQTEQYQQQVQGPLERFAKAFALLELQEKYIALAQQERELADRMSELKGREGAADPSARARMRDLQDEQTAALEELQALLRDIRYRAAELTDEEDFKKLRWTAMDFADAVEASRAVPAMMELDSALQDFRGSDALARSTEAAEVLESFIGRCKGGAEGSKDVCDLAFGPSLSESAALTAEQLLQGSGLGMGGRFGGGAGASGYSMRSATMRNVGLYGPAFNRQQGMSEGDRRAAPGAIISEPAGGQGEGGIARKPRSEREYEALPLHGVPPRDREHVRAYFERVAEETSAGTVLEEFKPEKDEKSSSTGGQR